jgi:cytochrome oxidase Cu insertion factor (SCO1/SenC/PrrC family)
MSLRAAERKMTVADAREHIRKVGSSGRPSELVALLSEGAPIYAGLRADEVDELRALILETFDKRELPGEMLPFVLEELQTGGNPLTVAAAARALRNAPRVPHEAAPLLVRAIDRFADADDVVEPRHSDRKPTTLLSELLRTLTWLGTSAGAGAGSALQSVADRHIDSFSDTVRADMLRALNALPSKRLDQGCCCHPEPAAVGSSPLAAASISPPHDAMFEDQDRAHTTFGAFFRGRPSVVTFFYTRCMIPEKCSLTVSKLARLQQAIADQGLRGCFNIAAITYDPDFDLAPRLRSFGVDRGMAFDARNRLLRTPNGLGPIQRYFELQVGFGAVTVNRHRLELFVLDDQAEIRASFTRMQWDEQKIFSMLKTVGNFANTH